MNPSQQFYGRAAALLIAGCSLTTTLPVFAADEALDGDAKPEEIVVTGSHIARADASSLGPMTTMTAEDIAQAAPTSIGDVLQQMPSVGVSLNSNGTQGTSFGVSSINLRYLGSAEGSGNRTLVLVDGHRWVNAVGGRGFRDFVDLNTIPLGIIDRVEVLKDGASAIYGADAIAGVVNIHTLKELDGIQVALRTGQTSRNDNENYSGYVNWGRRMDRASVLLSVSYNDSKPIRTEDRALTARARAPLTAAPTSPQGLFVLPGLAGNAYFGAPAGFANNAANAITLNSYGGSIGSAAQADDSFHLARLPADDYNTLAQGIYATGPSERAGVYGRFDYELTDSTSAHVTALYNKRKSSQLFAPFPLDLRGSNGFAIPNDQTYNPFGTANGVPLANALGFTTAAFRLQRVPVEVGSRDNRQEVETGRVAAGLEGRLALWGDWSWDVHTSYARNEATFDAINQIDLEHVLLGIGSPATCAATPGCVPLNLFGTLTPAMADYMRYNGHDENEATQFDVTANASRTLLELPGGPLGFAMGVEYRRETATDTPDAFAGTPSAVLPMVSGQPQSPTTSAARSATRGDYDLYETYLEFNAPWLADRPGIYRFETDAAIRYSKYSSFGGEATAKLGVAYEPVRSLLIRGTYSQGFRAPSILELHQGRRQTNFQAVDPCNGGGAGLPGCAGVPTTYNQSAFNSGLISGVTIGNRSLQPETADTFSAGLAFEPQALPGLALTADWFSIEVEDAIAAQTASQILRTCATSGQFCDLVARAPSGEVQQLSQAVVNLSRIEVSGVDASARYRIGTGIGEFEPSIDVAYLERFRSFIPQPDGTTVVDERAGKSDQPRSTFPRWKGQAALRYSFDALNASWKARYIGASDDIPGNAVNGGRIESTFFHDLQLGYDFAELGAKVAFGVDNVFDKQPPASAANNPINFDIYTYDIRGRYYYARVSLKY
jgi:outer membrane receptor protein involved in Fe transport